MADSSILARSLRATMAAPSSTVRPVPAMTFITESAPRASIVVALKIAWLVVISTRLPAFSDWTLLPLSADRLIGPPWEVNIASTPVLPVTSMSTNSSPLIQPEIWICSVTFTKARRAVMPESAGPRGSCTFWRCTSSRREDSVSVSVDCRSPITSIRSACSVAGSVKRDRKLKMPTALFSTSPTLISTPGARWPIVIALNPSARADRSPMPRSKVPVAPLRDRSRPKVLWPAAPMR